MTNPDDIDAAILAAMPEEPTPRSQVMERMPVACTLPQWYAAIERLVKRGAVQRVGRTKGMRYRLTSTEGTYV